MHFLSSSVSCAWLRFHVFPRLQLGFMYFRACSTWSNALVFGFEIFRISAISSREFKHHSKKCPMWSQVFLSSNVKNKEINTFQAFLLVMIAPHYKEMLSQHENIFFFKKNQSNKPTEKWYWTCRRSRTVTDFAGSLWRKRAARVDNR